MPFADHQHVGGPVVEQADGPVQLPRRHGGLGADDAGPVLLAAEAAPDLLDDNRDLVGGNTQGRATAALVAVGVLRRM